MGQMTITAYTDENSVANINLRWNFPSIPIR